jgi:sulfite reductase (NADPH) flavoprotein alpha-component
MLWWQARRQRPRLARNSAPAQADTVFVASENGSTWGFAQALHAALVQAGHAVHTSGLEHFQVPPNARQVLLLAATYGDGQAPAHAARALERIAQAPVTSARVAVLGFGDRQFPAFCAYAEALDAALRQRGWASLLPLERIHQQSAQFARWGERLAEQLGQPLTIDYRPRLPRTTELELVSRQDYPGGAGEPAAILRFSGPRPAGSTACAGARCRALPPATCWACWRRAAPCRACTCSPAAGATASSRSACAAAPACARATCMACSRAHASQHSSGPTRLHAGSHAPAGDADRRRHRRGAAGRLHPRQHGHTPMHLYYGARDPALDYYFEDDLQRWLAEQRLASLNTSFSHAAGRRLRAGGPAARRAKVARAGLRGAIVRVCGSQTMARRGAGARRHPRHHGSERAAAEGARTLCRRHLLNARRASACTAPPWARAGRCCATSNPAWTRPRCGVIWPPPSNRWTGRCRHGSPTATSCA